MQWYFLFEPNTSIVEQRCFFVLGTSWSPAPVSLMRAKWQTKLFQLNRMINSFHQPDRDIVQKVANATISVCGKGQRWDWSLHLVSAMQSQQGLANGCSLPEPDAVSYGTIISVLGKTVRWQRALLLLHECDARKTEGKLCSDRYRADRAPDLVCYNAAMAACGQGLQWLKAGAVLTAMIEKNIMPDALSISTLLTTFGNATRWQLALWHFSLFRFPRTHPSHAHLHHPHSRHPHHPHPYRHHSLICHRHQHQKFYLAAIAVIIMCTCSMMW